jgi:hypothetical protein
MRLMTTLYLLGPEVAGGFGPRTVITNQAAIEVGEATYHEVSRLEYCFDDWQGDDLLTTAPCYIATERLLLAMREAELTGFELEPVIITTSGA